ncbi:macrolide ABC transporter ATP-binding protein [Petrotoga miotherma DSM 10691]|uniref:Macrolide ABC transporter ATP-binding protein n=1 Tax=Petrotoga miotherma DSM 10691 TaxID=1434326 RepID=A0A2K1PH75_9BACT|nr:macrolide ABC transporter ATP-binding protein [Petrotoga sp. HWHPT.55.6.3]PNS02126.1 macrolide ABC transporter ATP-binding protein [Petrotoga miotherma DSM 10691]RPD35685.1 macrolide ABC transporter ATP-binding protein [Petrotoga sp. HWH.PT.55.6.1]
MIKAIELYKVYNDKRVKVEALKNINLTIKKGEFIGILGPSGSGKTTLLNCLSAIDNPTRGEIYFKGVPFQNLKEEERTSFRAKNMGFVFQFFNLIPVLTVLENVQLPLLILGEKNKTSKDKAYEVLKKVKLDSKVERFPYELSGGEQQRVAIARAIIHSPEVIWADEPTGNLDSENGEIIIELLEEIRKEKGTTLVVVTHDLNIAKRADRIIQIRDGIIQEV